MKRVIFACVHNAGRSQMAAAFFNALADPHRVEGLSAGTQPAPQIHAEVLNVMREVGIDLSAVKPRKLDDTFAAGATWLITLGCKENCPYLPGVKVEDWPLMDPKGQPVERVREIRDRVRALVVKFIAREGWGVGG